MSETTTCYTSIGFFLIPTLWKVRLQLNILWKEDHHELQIRTQTNRGISTLSHLPWLHTNFNHYQEHPNYRGLFSFYYLVLCSYANYRTSYRRMEHITYTIGPGEWICTVTDLQEWFRCRFQHQALSILRFFEEQNYITYSLLGKNRLVKFKISDWPKDNTVLEYNYPCKKIQGFSFSRLPKFTN